MADPILVNGAPIPYELCPNPAMAGGLRRYFENRMPKETMGGFLLLLLQGAQWHVVLGKADDINQGCLPEWGRWLYQYAPAGSWGSPEAVDAWLAQGVRL